MPEVMTVDAYSKCKLVSLLIVYPDNYELHEGFSDLNNHFTDGAA